MVAAVLLGPLSSTLLPCYVMAQETPGDDQVDTTQAIASQTDASDSIVDSKKNRNFAEQLNELQERQNRVEISTFPLVGPKGELARMQTRLEEAEHRISILETRANGGQPTGVKPPGTPIPTPPPENIVVVTSDDYTLRRTERGGLLWPPSKAAKVTFQLPAVDQCNTAGVWLIDNAGVSRIKNAFFVRNHDDETKAIWICEMIDGKWQSAIAEIGRTAHVIELKNGDTE